MPVLLQQVPLIYPSLQRKLDTLEIGGAVMHKKFGIDTIVRMDKSVVKFDIGEKKFIFPRCFHERIPHPLP
jgi:hypothetical protein